MGARNEEVKDIKLRVPGTKRGDKIYMEDKIIAAAIEYARDLFAGNSDGHDFEHTMRVYRNAMAIAETEDCDRRIVALAALLHDVDDYKLFDTTDNANARAFLHGQGVDSELAESIIAAVNSVSFSKNRDKRPETIEGCIVQDADRLDALGAIGIARTFSFGSRHGRELSETIRHFHEKLLLLKDMMNTKAAVRMAEERHKFMVDFLREWEHELE